MIKKWLLKINVSPAGYGSHSMRRGGATAAAKMHIRMHVLKRHGRWKSDAVYLYIDESTKDRLQVSEAVLLS